MSMSGLLTDTDPRRTGVLRRSIYLQSRGGRICTGGDRNCTDAPYLGPSGPFSWQRTGLVHKAQRGGLARTYPYADQAPIPLALRAHWGTLASRTIPVRPMEGL